MKLFLSHLLDLVQIVHLNARQQVISHLANFYVHLVYIINPELSEFEDVVHCI
jgi:hypothetical protein